MIMNDVDNYYLKLHTRCTYAHSWSEKLEWIGPICSKQDESTKVGPYTPVYQRVGLYSVADGRTVAEFLDSIT